MGKKISNPLPPNISKPSSPPSPPPILRKNKFYIIIRDKDNDLLRFPRQKEFNMPKDCKRIFEAEENDGTLKSEYQNARRFYEKYKDEFIPEFIDNLRKSLKREEEFGKKTNEEIADLLLKSNLYQYRSVFTYESDLLECIIDRLKGLNNGKKE